MKSMIFDTHAHYNDKVFDEDREAVLSGLSDRGVSTVVNICADLKSVSETIDLMDRYDWIYGAAGIHPTDSGELTEENFKEVIDALKHPKMLAVGEIGLDYYWDDPDRKVQKYWFERQIELSREVKKPLVIHSREAAADTIDMMTGLHAEEMGGVVHCYSYETQMAKRYLDMGFYLGIGGVVTYKNGKKLKEVVEYAPMDRLVLETDCPYLTPVPNRGKRNDSGNLIYVAEEIAALKGMTSEEVIRITHENARRLYRMD